MFPWNLERSIFDEGRGYYHDNAPHKLYLFRFDFKTETVSLLSETTMSLSVAELLGGQFSAPSEAYKFYEYVVEKTLTEEMNFLPAKEEVEFYDYGSTNDLLVYEVEKNQVTLRRDKIFTDGDLYFFNQLILEDVGVTTKSALQEGATFYSAENMIEFYNNTPWVSGMQDITHEEIVLESETYPFERLIIGNGFYREDRPDLFFANNRVKEIQILYEGHENSIEHYVVLEDTELKQSIPLLYTDSKKITIKILSVYPGTKYNDTCINYLVGVRDFNRDYYYSIPSQGER